MSDVDISRAFGPTPEERAEEEKKRLLAWKWIGPSLFEVAFPPAVIRDFEEGRVLKSFKHAPIKRVILEEGVQREDGWTVARFAGTETTKLREVAISMHRVPWETREKFIQALEDGPNPIDLIGGLSS